MHPIAAAWFSRRTSSAADWPVERLLAEMVRSVHELAAATGLVDEVVVVDSGSVDRTAEVAAAAGATVHHRDDILPDLGSYPGKGEVLWKALAVTTGDIVVYVDADLTDFQPHFVTGLLGPLLADPDI